MRQHSVADYLRVLPHTSYWQVVDEKLNTATAAYLSAIERNKNISCVLYGQRKNAPHAKKGLAGRSRERKEPAGEPFTVPF